MAVNKKRHKTKQLSILSRRLPSILIILSISTAVFVGLLHYNLNLSTFVKLNDLNGVVTISNDLDLATRPFNSEKFPLEQIFGYAPIWGSLNSGHYFGLKLSSPGSIETSLAWFVNDLNRDGRLDIRHLCDQNDNLNYYAWERHDFWSFGEQTIEDNGVIFRTSYQKHPQNHLEWIARIDVDSSDTNAFVKPVSLIQYVTTNRKDDWIEITQHPSRTSPLKNDILELQGHTKDTGDFVMVMKPLANDNVGKPILSVSHAGFMDKERYTVSSYLQSVMTTTSDDKVRLFSLSSKSKRSGYNEKHAIRPNIIAYQMTINATSTLLIRFKQKESPGDAHNELETRYDSRLKSKKAEFDATFAQTFPINHDELFKNVTNDAANHLAKVALSNMIGSIGHFYGLSFIGDDINKNKIAPYGPIQLLTGVPSRSFFPRGFLWDEAFHNLLISQWDPTISNRIIDSWFSIMNTNGWIPREVILGLESMRRVPREFLVQRITNANPPAMFIVIEQMLDKGTLSDATFTSIYPKLKVWYNWFNITQSGDKPSTYRWRGRDELSVSMLNPKTLTSGLDDYPRSSHPSPDEYHIDLRCWMALAARTLAKFAKRTGDLEFFEKVDRDANLLTDNVLLDQLHWSNKHGMYCDFGHNTEKAELILVTKTRISSHNKDRIETYQALERHSTGHPNFGCVPEFGYVSLFPMLLGILDPRNEKLGIMLEKMRDEDELWSPFGIRSLSKSSKYYNKYNTQHDKPYWRGAIWLNINYLILSSLKSYSNQDGPFKERCSDLFLELKSNIVNNVVNEFSRTRYIWESYDDQGGHGKGSHPFTGWSSLILLIMSSDLE